MLRIHEHRQLWMWAAILPAVWRGMPGTGLDHTSAGRRSTRYTVAALVVRQAAMASSAGLVPAGRFPLVANA